MTDANDERTFRCGWRIKGRAVDESGFSATIVRRGEWQLMMATPVYDAMGDEDFVDCVSRSYRDWAFERLERDLDTLARQLLAELEQRQGLALTDVPYSEVKAALYRWQKTKRDVQGAA